jgi:hypothetical protein
MSLNTRTLPKGKSAKICSICEQSYSEYGNNAEPVNSGRCCDNCNRGIVIPSRLNWPPLSEYVRETGFANLGEAIKFGARCLERGATPDEMRVLVRQMREAKRPAQGRLQ